MLIEHARALFTFDSKGDLLLVNDWKKDQHAPRFYLARSDTQVFCAFHQAVATEVRDDLLALVKQEPRTPNVAPRNSLRYQRVLADGEQARSGPAYYVSSDARLSVETTSSDRSDTGELVTITQANASLLDPRMSEWLDDVAFEQPMIAWIEDGVAVGVCSSVRTTPTAVEAGVEVLETHRRKGIGLAVVQAWAHTVLKLGKIPLYSTSSDNFISQSLAKSLGLTPIGSDFYII